MDMLTLSHVSKTFGSRQIINDISFSVPEGTVFGFIGQNGAGKTTTMKMILGLLKMDFGEITVNEKIVRYGQNKTNQYIGYLPDVPEFYGFMTPTEYLTLCGEITGMEKKELKNRIDQLLEMVGLSHVNKRIHGFSRGMKQRLGIAQALLNRPKLLICDEPTSALDPIGRKEILDILQAVKKETTVIFSTHILSDVERICDRIAFLHNGEIALQGTLDEIKHMHSGSGLEIEFCNRDDLVRFHKLYEKEQFEARYEPGHEEKYKEKYKEKHKSESESNADAVLKLRYEKKTEKDMLEIMTLLTTNSINVQRIERLEPNLEDLFMEVVSK